MNRYLNLIVVFTLLLSAGTIPAGHARAQVPVVMGEAPAPGVALQPATPLAMPDDSHGSNPPPSGPHSLLAFAAGTGQPEAEAFALVGETAAPEDLGDWSNTAALACILPLGATYNFNTVTSLLAKPPPLDLPPSLAAYAANLGLKFCAPYVEAPVGFVTSDQGSCQAEFYQPRITGSNFNVMGVEIPFSDVFPGKFWGELGTPVVLHWSTGVSITLQHGGPANPAPAYISLPTGVNTLTWRGDTMIHPLDYIFIYIPGLGSQRETLRTALNGSKFVLDKVIRLLVAAQPNPAGIYNEEFQTVAVTDFVAPQISGPTNITVEAIEPGGVSRLVLMNELRRGISHSDNCDTNPTLASSGAPEFAAVGASFSVTWTVRDDGPHGLSGGFNEATLVQAVTVADTKPPVILAPPSIVTETTTIPATIDLGYPAVFDLADLDPAISNDAPAQFPLGQTLVTWTATDDALNTSTATQLVNVKSPGSNHAPTAQSQTGGSAAQAISYEPLTITVSANDSDLDPLWFSVENQPANGFLHAPLYPYFIQDYRLANFSEISFLTYCADPAHRQQYIPTNWPVNASFMAVADDGTTYVHDQGMVYCMNDGSVDADYRLAVFKPDGTWTQVASSFDVKGIYVDWRRERLFEASHDTGGSVAWVREYDLDLNLLKQHRMDYALVPPGQTRMNQPKQALVDAQGIMYVTNGFIYQGAAQLYLFDTNVACPFGYCEPIYLADYSISGVVWNDLALDSEGNLYASAGKQTGNSGINRVYKFSPATLDGSGFTPGTLIGWLGKCDSGPDCDIAHQRSFGFSCTDATCAVAVDNYGSGAGQFHSPRGIGLDPNDILYVTDYYNQRVQRFTPDGLFAGQAISECDGSCFVLGDFGNPEDISVNAHHFYVLDDSADLLHIFETSTIHNLTDNTATLTYQSENNFVGIDSLSFSAGDGLATSAPAIIEINVSRNFRPPVAEAGLAFTGAEDTPLPITLSGYDPDEHLDTLTYQVVTPPANGVVSGSEPNRVYTPNPDFVGIDTFTFAAFDGVFLSAPETVTVTLTPVNDAPRFPTDEGTPLGYAFRLAGELFDLSRLTALDDVRVGRGFSTVFEVNFFDPDSADRHLVTVNWDDGSPVEPEGRLLADGTITGPLLAEGQDGGAGSVTARHTFSQDGVYDVQVCITDNVSVDSNGNKSPTATSVTACQSIPVTVAAMTDILLDLEESADPLPLDRNLVYHLSVTNHAPQGWAGLTATGLVISDTLDSRVSYQYANASAGSCGYGAGVITCNLDSLAPGQTAIIEIGVSWASELAAGDVLNNEAGFRLNELNQADTTGTFETTTLVVPADYVVNTLEDASDAVPGDGACATSEGRCTLRAAIQEANSWTGAQTIALGAETYIVSPTLPIAGPLTLVGLGADRTSLAGGGASGVLSISGGHAVTLEGLAITAGNASGMGGGVYNDGGSLTLTGVQVSGNYAAGGGGGIWSNGSLTLTQSAVTGNSSDASGGGLLVQGTATLANVTISGNTAGSGGGIAGLGTAALTNVTIANNHATGSGGGLNGGPANFTLFNTILSDNTAAVAGPNCGYGLTSQGYNLFGDLADCAVSGATTGNIIGQAAGLAPLSLNGANTLTHALNATSPATDAGTCALIVDQRGIARPQDGDLDQAPACDIGAYELAPVRLYLPVISR